VTNTSTLVSFPMRRAPWGITVPVGVAVAAAAGGLAAAGRGRLELAMLAALLLVLVGNRISMMHTRAILLATLLLVPDIPSGASVGFYVRWSLGLTLSNFVVPAVAVPLLLGAALAGHRIMPARWPGLARWCYWLLAWCVFTLMVPMAQGEVNGADARTLLAHLGKLAFFIWLGVVIAAGADVLENQRMLERVLCFGVLGNTIVGLMQAVGWLVVFSPLGQRQPGLGVRVSGLFYDANMYGALCAWALLWLAQAQRAPGWRGRAQFALMAGVAINLLATGSRAGYLALAAGAVVMAWYGGGHAVRRAASVLVLLALMFPLQSWQRLAAAAETVQQSWIHHTIVEPIQGDVSTQERLMSMREALRQIAQHPWLGIGFGRALYLGVQAIGDGTAVRAGAEGSFNGAQNMGLSVLAETCPLGLALFLMAIAEPWRRLRPRVVSGDVARLAGFAGLLAACFTIEALWNTRLLALVVMLTASGGGA
jgi:hypothetical protein